MALTYGFYNSVKGDRKYDAMQFSEIIDTLIIDGIIPSKGQLFAVTSAGNGMQVNVGTGMAWFFHSWTKNDSVMVLTVEESDITRPRIDAVVLEVNREDNVRANSIKIVKGEPNVNAEKPTLVTTEKVHQYPLAWITVPAAAEEIKAENIENAVGLTPTVFATGILDTAPLDDLWNQWEGEWDTWFAAIKLQLSGDVVANLQGQIEELKEKIEDVDTRTHGIKTVTNTYVDVFTEDGIWKNHYGFDVDVFIRCVGGGGGELHNSIGSSAGGGGHMRTALATIPPNGEIPITIGSGGTGSSSSPAYGGTTSAGVYVSASGGTPPIIYFSKTDSSNITRSVYRGGDGGAGGGGGRISASYQRYFDSTQWKMGSRGGNGTYGGGGGGSGSNALSASNDYLSYPGVGGAGGQYGGGGGGGGAHYANTYYGWPTNNGLSGGVGGSKGGSGGKGGDAYTDDTIITTSDSGVNGTDTIGTSEEFTGNGSGGLGVKSITARIGSGGGGGGGYGGQGGNGEAGSSANFGNGTANSGAGGGGGGYGAKGGNGGNGNGGGGGGYGGQGANGNEVGGYGYGAGGGNGGGGGYGTKHLAGSDGASGICIITYTIKQVVFEEREESN